MMQQPYGASYRFFDGTVGYNEVRISLRCRDKQTTNIRSHPTTLPTSTSLPSAHRHRARSTFSLLPTMHEELTESRVTDDWQDETRAWVATVGSDAFGFHSLTRRPRSRASCAADCQGAATVGVFSVGEPPLLERGDCSRRTYPPRAAFMLPRAVATGRCRSTSGPPPRQSS